MCVDYKLEECKEYSSFNIISKPKTLGDLCCIRLLNIVITFLCKSVFTKEELLKKEIVVESLIKNKATEIMYSILKKSETISYTLLDSALIYFRSVINDMRLILCGNISLNKLLWKILKIMIRKNSNSNHIVVGLGIIGKLVIKADSLKFSFIEKGGFKLIYSNFSSNKKELVSCSLELLHNLLYVRNY